MPSGVYSFPRPTFGRQRSNSVPALGLVNVSAEEAGILFSAAERATARRKRPVSVDSPGPVVNTGYDSESLPQRTFNFSTPSRYGLGGSPLKNAQSKSLVIESSEDEDIEPTPPPTQSTIPSAPTVSIRPPSDSSTLPPSPISPRRQVNNPTLKAYADGIFLFTQSRLNTASPQTLQTLGLKRDPSMPATPELEGGITELRPQRPVLRSQFSDWSQTTMDTDADREYLSSAPPSEPTTPGDESGMMSPDSFFSEVTPRVAQSSQWTSLSSARPSSGAEGVLRPFDSPYRRSQIQSASTSTSESFSYFTGFDGATAATTTRLSRDFSFVDASRSSYTPSRIQSSSRGNNMAPQSEPSSVASNSIPLTGSGPHTPFGEALDLSRPPSWLVRAIC